MNRKKLPKMDQKPKFEIGHNGSLAPPDDQIKPCE